jgi:hypothetical protein
MLATWNERVGNSGDQNILISTMAFIQQRLRDGNAMVAEGTIPMAYLSFQRAFEREADWLAVRSSPKQPPDAIATLPARTYTSSGWVCSHPEPRAVILPETQPARPA